MDKLFASRFTFRYVFRIVNEFIFRRSVFHQILVGVGRCEIMRTRKARFIILRLRGLRRVYWALTRRKQRRAHK